MTLRFNMRIWLSGDVNHSVMMLSSLCNDAVVVVQWCCRCYCCCFRDLPYVRVCVGLGMGVSVGVGVGVGVNSRGYLPPFYIAGTAR